MELRRIRKNNISSVFIGNLIKNGYKSKSEKVYFKLLRDLKKKKIQDSPINYLKKNVEDITPLIKFIKKKVGGSAYEIPFYLSESQQLGLGVRAVIEGSKTSIVKNINNKLSKAIIEVNEGTGELLRKKRVIDEKGVKNRVYLKFLN